MAKRLKINKQPKVFNDFRGGWNADGGVDSRKNNELAAADNVDLVERGPLSSRWGTRPMRFSGTLPAQTGATNVQIILPSTASAVDDYYNGAYVLVGTQKRTISDYVGATKLATVSVAWDPQPAESNSVEVIFAYAAEVRRVYIWPRNDGSEVILAMIGNSLSKVGTDGKILAAVKTVDNGNDFGCFWFNDKFYFTGKESATDKYWQYDGTTCAEVTPDPGTGNDLAPIKKCRFFTYHPDSYKVFASGNPDAPLNLYHSEANNAAYFKTGTNFMVPTQMEGPCVGVGCMSSGMLAAYKRGWYSWTGTTVGVDAKWTKLPINIGPFSIEAARLTPNSFTFPGTGGLWSFTEAALDREVVMITGRETQKNLAEDKVATVINGITNATGTRAWYWNRRNMYLLAYADTAGAAVNDKVLVLDWSIRGFTRYQGIQANHFAESNDGTLYIASKNHILVFDENCADDWDCTNSEYKAITGRIKTKDFDFDQPMMPKYFEKFAFEARQFAKFLSTVNITLNYTYHGVELGVVSMDESLIWGRRWGLRWGWTDYVPKEAIVHEKAHRCAAEFEWGALGQKFTLYAVAWDFTPLPMEQKGTVI